MKTNSQFHIEKELYVDHIDIKLTGTASARQIKAFYQDTFNVADEKQVNKLLVDTSRLILDYDSLEILQVMKSLKENLSRFKVARVVPSIGHKQLLIQQIAENKQLDVRNFADKQTATNWLFD
ncbi:hypothetical protein HII17_17125 [Thalassotalea sp. M1531]|uniref:STAS/SEC14 domain-containing protein n=1 Tax=Thalassotalea algicola TaxID=2716224 RepID=A0A7Y0LFB7_9GAMM|nr:hypothetical protein [Thalassotalea algicola]NMP33278.1 hypothetical protein [Thalassotalea algicola]